MSQEGITLKLKHESLRLNSSWVDTITVAIEGKLLKTASIAYEWEVDIEDPHSFLRDLKASEVRADIFTFMQRLPETSPKFPYYFEWDNVASIPITTFDHWWTKQINDKVRNRARKAEKKGVEIRLAEFNDKLILGIMGIFNETPIRQGKPFSHYGNNFRTIKRQWSDRVDRANFITAYCQDELIGFIKLISAGRYTRTSGTVSKIAHRDKSPMNALIAKAVEFCADNNSPYLVYGKFVYGKKGSDTLTNFKHSNGFKQFELPRYYIPLTMRGEIALRLGLHHGVLEILPKKLILSLIEFRKKYYEGKRFAK